jgi:hypothetical protein
MRPFVLLLVFALGCHRPSMTTSVKNLGSKVAHTGSQVAHVMGLDDAKAKQLVVAAAQAAVQTQIAAHPIVIHKTVDQEAPAPAPGPDPRPAPMPEPVVVHHEAPVPSVLFQRVETSSGVVCNKLDSADACQADCGTRMRQHAMLAAGKDDGFRSCLCMQPEATGC